MTTWSLRTPNYRSVLRSVLKLCPGSYSSCTHFALVSQPIKGSKDEGPLFPNRSHPLYPTKMVSYQNYQQFFQHPLNSSSQCLAHTTHDGHRQTIDGVSQNEQQNTKNSHQRYFSASHNQSMVSHDGNRTITPPGFKAPRSADPFETLIAGAPSNQPNDHRGNQFFGVTMLGPSLLVHRNPQMLQRIRHSSGPTGDMSLLTPSSSTSSRSTTNNSTEGMDVTSLLGIPELGFANGNQMTSLYPFHPSRTSLALSSLETMGMASPMAPIIIAKELPIVREMQASKLKVDERRLTLGFFEGITREANSLVSKVTPSSDELQSMEKIVKNLQDSLQTLLPGIFICLSVV